MFCVYLGNNIWQRPFSASPSSLVSDFLFQNASRRILEEAWEQLPAVSWSHLEHLAKRARERRGSAGQQSTMCSLLLTMMFILTQKQVIKSSSNADWGEDQVGFGFWTFKIAVHRGGEFSEWFLHDCPPWSAVWIQTGLPWVGVVKAAGWRKG